MGVLKDRSAWHLWHSLAENLAKTNLNVPAGDSIEGEYYFAGRGDEGYREPVKFMLERFLSFQLNFYGEKDLVFQHLILSINGGKSLPRKKDTSSSMNIDTQSG